MQRPAVDVRVHRHRRQPHLPAGAYHPQGNFTTIGNQNFFDSPAHPAILRHHIRMKVHDEEPAMPGWFHASLQVEAASGTAARAAMSTSTSNGTSTKPNARAIWTVETTSQGEPSAVGKKSSSEERTLCDKPRLPSNETDSNPTALRHGVKMLDAWVRGGSKAHDSEARREAPRVEGGETGATRQATSTRRSRARHRVLPNPTFLSASRLTTTVRGAGFDARMAICF